MGGLFLIRILELGVFPSPKFTSGKLYVRKMRFNKMSDYALPLRRDVFDEHLNTVFRLERADKSRIPARHSSVIYHQTLMSYVPELARYPEVFAASHERVTLAAFGGCRYPRGIEVFLLSASDADQTEARISDDQPQHGCDHLPAKANKSVLPAYDLGPDVRLATGC